MSRKARQTSERALQGGVKGCWVKISPSGVGWICSLTYLENWLRIKSGGIGYSKGFIIKYIEPILYPAGLTYYHQVVLGIFVVVLNLAIYGYIFKPIGWFLPKREIT